jgi:small subunit ribosomal protein S6
MPLLYSPLGRLGGFFVMSHEPTLYDLVLLLSASAEADARAAIIAEVTTMIESGGGTIAHKQEWGQRPTTFEINHQAEADYYLLQFTGPAAVLETLEHSLRINDSVLRFRIIKVAAGTPAVADSAPPVLAGAGATASLSPAEPDSE